MKIKVCGMQRIANIDAIDALQPDYIGFIFYPKSKRLINTATLDYLIDADINAQKVGVFVNQNLDDMTFAAKHYKLNAIQLHGDEPPAIAAALKEDGIKVIKAFQIDEHFDWSALDAYYDTTDFFLFDTASPNYGGSGKKFNWQLLENYKLDKPYFLSGGISPQDVDTISTINLPYLYAVDLNSKFEIEPGLKDDKAVQNFITTIHDYEIPSR